MKNTFAYRFICVMFLWLATINAYAQKTKTIKGTITAENTTVSGIHIVNLSNEKSTITNDQGYFEITASEDDLLVFSAVHLHYWRQRVDTKAFERGTMEVKMNAKQIDLDAVEVVEYKDINAVSLGIVSPNIKRYTPAERRLKTAGDFKYWHLVSILGGTLELDPIINKISGRTKMLKKELEIEKRERYLEVLDYEFEDAFFVEKLEIDSLYVDGFKYFIVEFEPVQQAIDTKEFQQLRLYMGDLSIAFNDFFKQETNFLQVNED